MFLLNTRKICYLLFWIFKIRLRSSNSSGYYKICKFSNAFIHQEFPKISTLLQKNGFPTHYIDHHIAKFFNQKYQTINSTETPKPRLLFIRLPYVHLLSNQIRKESNSLFQKRSIKAKLILIDETFLTLADFLHIKTNSTHYATPMWCIKSTVVAVNFIQDRHKEI